MLVAKQVADLITLGRGMLAFFLVGLGLLQDREALPLVAWLMIVDWCGDMVDGPLARRSRLNYHTWIGDHDLQIDMLVSVGLLIYLVGAGYVSLWLGVLYLLFWALIFLKLGVQPAPGMLFQAPTYFWFIWTAVRDVRGMGILIILLIITAMILTWPKFPQVMVPGFLEGMRKAIRPSQRRK